MKRVLLSIAAIMLCSLVAGCGGGDSASKNSESSQVSISIGGNGQAGKIVIEKDTYIARANVLIRHLLATTAAFAAIPSNVTHIVFTISAPDITTITRDVPVVGQTSVTETFIVPNGTNRRFLVEAKDSAGNVLFRKEAFSNLDGSPVTLTLNMEDVAPPTFAGLLSATAVSSSQIDLSWTPATDNLTVSSTIAYNVYASKTSGGQNFSTPGFVTSPGATSFSATGLESNTIYYFVVRADDRNGNVDTNRIEKSARTIDGTPPTFAGLASATPSITTSGRIDLFWNPAADTVTPSANIVYQIYMSTTPGGQNFVATPYTTGQGATSYTMTGLAPGNYYFVVRARDAAGNTDVNRIERSASSDIIPPFISSVSLVNVPAGEGEVAQITVNFSEQMDNASITAPKTYNITCSNDCNNPNILSTVPGLNNSSIVLTLSDRYACYMIYELTVSPTITDLAGNPMTAIYTWIYQTGC